MSRLLVQVRMLREDTQQPKDTISLSSTIVKNFSMKMHKDVFVHVVLPSDVAITLVEVCDAVQFFEIMNMDAQHKHIVLLLQTITITF